MKTTTLILASFIFLASCKDKKKDPEPTQPVEVKKQVSVKINGSLFDCNICANTYRSGGLSGVNFSEGSTNRFIFNISGFLTPGTYAIESGTKLSFTYEKDGYYYRGKGSLTITETDTSSSGNLRKFIGTFNCKTDTNAGKSFDFTEGAININF